MSRGELRAARGPANNFGLDDSSRHRQAVDAARAIIANAATSRASPPVVSDPTGAGKRLPPARPAHPPQSGRAGRVRIDAEVVLGVLIGLAVAVAIAGLSHLARHGGAGL